MGVALLRRLAAGVAGAGLAMALSAPAVAEETTHSLDPSHERTVASDHPQKCADGTDGTDPHMASRGDGESGWHFRAHAGEIGSLTVTVAPHGDEDGGYEEITRSRSDEPSDSDEAPDRVVAFLNSGAHLFLPEEWLLITATAEVVGGDGLVVAHTCVGAPDPDPTAQATEQPDEEGSRHGLPVTGAQVGGLLVLGCGLLSAGFAMIAVRRRRDLSHLLEP